MQLEDKTDVELALISDEAFRHKKDAQQIISAVNEERDRRKEVRIAELNLELESLLNRPTQTEEDHGSE